MIDSLVAGRTKCQELPDSCRFDYCPINKYLETKLDGKRLS